MTATIHSRIFAHSDFIVANMSIKVKVLPGGVLPFKMTKQIRTAPISLTDIDGTNIESLLINTNNLPLTDKTIEQYDLAPEDFLPIFQTIVSPLLDEDDVQFTSNRYAQCTRVLLEALCEAHDNVAVLTTFSVIPKGYDAKKDEDDILDDISFGLCASAHMASADADTADVRISVIVNKLLPVEFGEKLVVMEDAYDGVVSTQHFYNILQIAAPFLNDQQDLIDSLQLDNVLVCTSTDWSSAESFDELSSHFEPENEDEEPYTILTSPYKRDVGIFVVHADEDDDVACSLTPYDKLKAYADYDGVDLNDGKLVDLSELALNTNCDFFNRSFQPETVN